MAENNVCFARNILCWITVISVIATLILYAISTTFYREHKHGMMYSTLKTFKLSSDPNITTLISKISKFNSVIPQVPYIPEKYFVKPKWEEKYFIYDCSSGLCGGYGDRQEGVVGAYVISQMLQRKFKLRMLIPCDIGNHLEPNKQDWVFKPDEVKGLSSSKYVKLDKDAWALRDRIAQGLDLEGEFPRDVTYFLVNQEMVSFLIKHPKFALLEWARNETAMSIYNIVLRRLFKMKSDVQERFNQFQIAARSNGRKLACAHIRMHGNPTIPLDGYFPDDPGTRAAIWKFLKQYNNSDLYRIFVATDSDQIRRDSRRMFPDVIQEMAGNIIHVDRDTHSKQYACEGFAKVILDQQIMASCDKFFMSDSGLGRVGAMLRGTDKGLYCINKKRTDFRECHFLEKGFFPSYW